MGEEEGVDMTRRKLNAQALGGAFAAGSLLLVLLVVVGVARGGQDAGAQEFTAPTVQPLPAEGNGAEFGEHGIADLVDEAWLLKAAEDSGIPERALRAYAGAEIAFRQDLPECRVDWATLAGIGYVESRHGTLRGGRIDGSGQQTPPIYGIPLDGTNSAEVPDTDGGELDGDDVWDRAVGPLQFIPSTWDYMGADGNRDGIADPQNIDDAALAAARYLCRVGADLGTAGNWIEAVHRYNRSLAYNNQVADATDRYRSAVGAR